MGDDKDAVVKLLEEICTLQQKSLETQRQVALLGLPIFALLSIGIILGLGGFLGH